MTVLELLAGTRVVPVIEIERVEDAAPLARALKAGGAKVAELTLRTEAAIAAMQAMQAAEPDLCVGMGSVLNTEMLQASVEAGAEFLVTPGTPGALLEALAACGVPALPGVATATEAVAVASAGFEVAKFFPAEAAGGTAVLKSLAGPIKALKFCPTGGIGAEDVSRYLALPNVVCVGGSWVASKALMAAGDWDQITDNARISVAPTA